MTNHLNLFAQFFLLGSLSLDISMDQNFAYAAGDEGVPLVISNTQGFHFGSRKFHIIPAVQVACFVAMIFSSLSEVTKSSRNTFLKAIYLVGNIAWAAMHYLVVLPKTDQSLDGTDVDEYLEAAYLRMILAAMAGAVVLLGIMSHGLPSRPEVTLLGLCLSLNMQDSVFDIPAILAPSFPQESDQWVHQAVINNTVHVEHFIHTYLVPLIIGGLGVILLYRIITKRQFLDIALLVMVASGGPGFILLVEPKEEWLKHMTDVKRSTDLSGDDVNEALMIIGAGHAYITLCSIVGALIQSKVLSSKKGPKSKKTKHA